MTVKERLYHLIDALPENEARMVERMLRGLHLHATGGLPAALRDAPPDDEPYTDEERGAVAEAWEDVKAERMHTMAEVKRELGL